MADAHSEPFQIETAAKQIPAMIQKIYDNHLFFKSPATAARTAHRTPIKGKMVPLERHLRHASAVLKVASTVGILT